MPRRTTQDSAGSSATSHFTRKLSGAKAPSVSYGFGAKRAHRTTAVGSGSPDLVRPDAAGFGGEGDVVDGGVGAVPLGDVVDADHRSSSIPAVTGDGLKPLATR